MERVVIRHHPTPKRPLASEQGAVESTLAQDWGGRPFWDPARARATIAAMSPSPDPDRVRPPLWQCPACGRTFANRNQTHTCALLSDVDRQFAGTSPEVRATFDRIVEAAAALGPVEVLGQKTRVALHVRMSFAALVPHRRWLDGHLVLARRVDSARFTRVEVFSPRNILHAFRLTGPDEVDDEFRGWLAEAHHVGEQRHLRQSPATGARDNRA